MAHTLPDLPYAIDALGPYMSQETLEYHHGKHHNTYVVNLNNLVKGWPVRQRLGLAGFHRQRQAGSYLHPERREPALLRWSEGPAGLRRVGAQLLYRLPQPPSGLR